MNDYGATRNKWDIIVSDDLHLNRHSFISRFCRTLYGFNDFFYVTPIDVDFLSMKSKEFGGNRLKHDRIFHCINSHTLPDFEDLPGVIWVTICKPGHIRVYSTK